MKVVSQWTVDPTIKLYDLYLEAVKRGREIQAQINKATGESEAQPVAKE